MLAVKLKLSGLNSWLFPTIETFFLFDEKL